MKLLHGEASVAVGAPIEECLALLAAVERYPSWYPDVIRHVLVVERDAAGLASRAEVSLRVAYGPLVKDLQLLLAVRVERPGTVVLTRIPHGPPDEESFAVTWWLETEGEGTRIHVSLDAEVALPRFVPLGDVGDGVAAGFVRAAAAALSH